MENTLLHYIQTEIIPRYDAFDAGHQRGHVEMVIEQSMELAKYYDVDLDMVYVIAAYHDIGLEDGREWHHVASGKKIYEDKELKRYFNENQIKTMAEAAEDHRASNKEKPRSIYGKIVAEADRSIDAKNIIERTIQYSIFHYPDYTKEEHWERVCSHLQEKYAEGGYLRLWIPESKNAQNLKELRKIIKDKQLLRIYFEQLFERVEE